VIGESEVRDMTSASLQRYVLRFVYNSNRRFGGRRLPHDIIEGDVDGNADVAPPLSYRVNKD